jgi:hypothetical protein
MKGRRVDGWFRIRLGRGPEHAGGAFKELITPLLDLIGAPIKVLSQLDQGLLPLDRGNGHLCLECRTVIPARSSRHGLLLARGNHTAVARKTHLSQLFRFPEPPLSVVDGARKTAVPPVVEVSPHGRESGKSRGGRLRWQAVAARYRTAFDHVSQVHGAWTAEAAGSG